MPTGKIKAIKNGYGFIQQDNGGPDVYFKVVWVKDVSRTEVVEGLRVEYETRKTDKGLQTKWVRRLKTDIQRKQPQPTTRHVSSHSLINEYRFLNPYNFVRFLDKPNPVPTKDDDPERQLLWRCPPPPRDRYVGLSGRIACEIEAVTPLFISDSHAVEDNEGHKTYRFFEYDGQPALPASSLRGMIRAVFEAVTNSCLGIFEKNRRLEYRETSIARFMKAGIVQTLPRSDDSGKILLCTEAKIPAYFNNPDKNLLDSSWKCGEEAFAVVRESRRGNKVTRLSKEKHILRANPGEKIVQGRVKIGGLTIENKRHEALFYNPTTNVLFSWERMEDYNAVSNKQQENDDFKTTIQSQNLSVGDLVYVELEYDNKFVRNIASVKVPRFRYRKTIGDLLSPNYKHLHSCTNFTSLCPACRTFGWVWKPRHKNDKPPQDKPVAYAGRVRFSHGTTEKGKYEEFDQPITLAILSSPKPTTTLFYLLDQQGKPADVNYNTPNAQLRGRKAYRHHGIQLKKEEYIRAANGEQNRTIRDALKPGAKFSFTLDFENLAEVELGALLWALELEKGMHHRLGYAKPLGFGSVRAKVTGLKIMQPRQRYTSFAVDRLADGWQDKLDQKDAWKGNFIKTMTDLYNNDFYELDSIKDLCCLLNEPPELPIHYPRPDPKLTEDDKEENFRWFGDNEEPLQLAPDDKGFTIPPSGQNKKRGKK